MTEQNSWDPNSSDSRVRCPLSRCRKMSPKAMSLCVSTVTSTHTHINVIKRSNTEGEDGQDWELTAVGNQTRPLYRP